MSEIDDLQGDPGPGPRQFAQLDPANQARIRANLAKMQAQNAPDADVETYLRDVEHLAPTTESSPISSTPVSAGPGFIRRGIGDLVLGAAQAIRHPIDTMEHSVVTPFLNAMAPSPEEIQEQQQPGSLTGGMLAARGGASIPPAQQSIPSHTVRPGERGLGLAQTAANLIVPGATKAVLPALGFWGKAGALSAIGSGMGALQNPSDPAAGAVAGAIGTPLLGAAGNQLAEGANSLADIAAVRRAASAVPSAGAEAVARAAAKTATDKLNYGAAKAEAAANGNTSPAAQALLQSQRIAPLADEIRASYQLQGLPTDDYSILSQLHNELSAKEGPLIDKLTNTTGSKALTQRQQADIQAIKGQIRDVIAALGPERQVFETAQSPTPGLRQAIGNFWDQMAEAARRNPGNETVAQQSARTALERHGAENVVSPPLSGAPSTEPTPALAPSYPGAVAEHAAMAQGTKEYMRGYNDAGTMLADQTPQGRTPAATQRALETKSPEGLQNGIASKTPGAAAQYLQGVLARTQETQGHMMDLPGVHSSMFGTIANRLLGQTTNYNRVAPYVEALYKQMGQPGMPRGPIGTLGSYLDPTTAMSLAPIVSAPK